MKASELLQVLDISTAIATVRDQQALLALVGGKVKPLFDFEDCGIFVVSPDGRLHRNLAAVGPAVSAPARSTVPGGPDPAGLGHPGSPIEHMLRELARRGGPLVFDWRELRRHHADYPPFQDEGAAAYRDCLAAELRTQGQVIGLFCLNAPRENHFQPGPFPLFQAVADQVAGAVANILAHEDLARRVREKDLELAVTNALVSSQDRESLCLALAGQMSQLVPFSFFTLCYWKSARETHYEMMLRRDATGAFASVRREMLQLAPPELTYAEQDELQARPGVYVGAAFEALADRYPLYAFLRQQFGLNAQLRLSLHSRTGVTTSIVLLGPGAHDFAPADHDTLQRLTPQISLALDNLLAFENRDRHRREKEVQVAVTNVLTNAELTLSDLLPAVAGLLDTLVRSDLVQLFLPPPHTPPDADVGLVREQGQLRPLTQAEVQPHLPGTTLFESLGQLRELAAEPRLYVGDDDVPAAVAPVPLLRYFYAEHGIRALLLVPLRVNDDLVGGLLLGHRFAYGFTGGDLHCLTDVGIQMALALGHRFAFAEITSWQRQLAHENTYLQEELNTAHNFAEIIGTSPLLLEVFRQVSQVAGTDTTVCIGGETGTGKELIARALHNRSPRHERLLVKVNCAALPAQLIESELFGHEKGSFTGAHERRTGKFELADGGTIFLDEIGELPLELQAKLLRVVQEKEIERLGGKGPIRTDVRIIAATNRDLAQEVLAGRFRQDLYFRLMVFPLVLPPLRERKEDLPALANHFLAQYARKLGKPHQGLAPATLRDMMAYDWPGNIRELQHVLEQAVIVSSKPLLQLARPLRPPAPAEAPEVPEPFRQQTLAELERKHIVATLGYTNGRVRGRGGAAELLAIKATTLEARMKKLGIGKSYAVLPDASLN